MRHTYEPAAFKQHDLPDAQRRSLWQQVSDESSPLSSGVTMVGTGKLAIGFSPAQFVAVLGSCVGVAIYDETAKLGGLVHVMIPESSGYVLEPGRYADTAIAALVSTLKSAGGRREHMRALVAGGANVLQVGNADHHFRIGERNASMVRRQLAAHRIPIVHEDVGGKNGRKMWVTLRNFEMRIKQLVAPLGGNTG